MNIFVGNLSHEVCEDDLIRFFTAYGCVSTVALVRDPNPHLSASGRNSQYSNSESRTYAYVEMPDKTEALAAILGANAKQIRGLAVTVLQAMPLGKTKSRDK